MAPTLQPMDTLLINGQILTMDAQMSVQQAVAIRGDRIQAVGDNETLQATAQADTHVIDL
jgi:predicted amidohydrolase YtcJ